MTAAGRHHCSNSYPMALRQLPEPGAEQGISLGVHHYHMLARRHCHFDHGWRCPDCCRSIEQDFHAGRAGSQSGVFAKGNLTTGKRICQRSFVVHYP